MTIKNRNLAKGIVPALLLSAALSVPATAHADKGKHQEKAQQHAQQAQKQANKAQKQANKAQRQSQQARQQRPARVVAPQRVVVVPQRVVVPQQRVVVRQPVVVANPRNRRSWDGWNRRYNKYGSNAFQLDGTFVNQQYGCVLVQDHQGQVIPLVGNPGDLRRGEHLLLNGRVENGTVCGTAFRVSSVERVWANTNHSNVLFDRRRDGEYRGYDERYGRDDRRYDDRRYDDRRDRGYDPDGRRAISIDGRLDDSGDCPVIRGDRGEYYDLVGDLSGFRDGARARVVGRDGLRSNCGGQAIEVSQIIRR
jgi:hypothetical protein